jgi:hypothetical protein
VGRRIFLFRVLFPMCSPKFQHPPAHHPLDACSYSVVDEPQLGLVYGFTMVTNYVRNRFHI